MSETLREYADSRGLSLRIDRHAGVLRGVKILGLVSRNGRVYLPEALRQAAALYEGAKVHVNHAKSPGGGPRDYQDRIGRIRGVEFRADEGLFADFHFNPKHALAEQLLWDAEHAPENVGFSHNVEARVARRGEQTIIEAITRVESVDLVADPATTRGLFESAGTPSDSWPGRPAAADSNGPTAAEGQAEVERLREELARAREELAARLRADGARRLLAEHGLPDLQSNDPLDRAIVSPLFFDSLLACGDDRGRRALVEDRARLVRALRGQAGGSGQPVARDPWTVEGETPPDARALVRAIT